MIEKLEYGLALVDENNEPSINCGAIEYHLHTDRWYWVHWPENIVCLTKRGDWQREHGTIYENWLKQMDNYNG